jgi:outer membrane PBP1 activator LpoA protein
MRRSAVSGSKQAVATGLLCPLIVLAVVMAGCATSPPPAPHTPDDVREQPPSPSRKLSPEVGRAEEEQLRQAAEAKIEGTENVVKTIGKKTLAKDQQEMLSTIRSFLSKSKEALSIKDFSKAYNLANKAFILAQELSGTIR